MPVRRDFLKSTGAGVLFCACELSGVGALSAGRQTRSPVTIGGKRIRTIDIHAHTYIHDDWHLIRDRPEAEGLLDIIDSPLLERLTSIEGRIAEMDRQSIDVQALSLYVGQYHYWAERGLSEELVAIQNAKLAEMVGMHPDRFVGLGAVSLHYPELAATQVAQAVKDYGFPGFMITGSVNGEEVSAPRFDPFWAKAEELGCVIFMHPRGFAEAGQRFSGNGWLANTVGNPLETTVALSHMIFDGFLDRFPALSICAAHGGGYLPSYIGRSDNCYSFDPRCQQMARKPSEYLRQLYFDTLVYSSGVLRHLIDEVGADRLVLGSDYPFPVASRDPLGDVLDVAGLSDEDRKAIFERTAARLLKIA